MALFDSGACPCDPLNPPQVASNTFLPAILGLPFFYGKNRYSKPAPIRVCLGNPDLRLPVQ